MASFVVKAVTRACNTIVALVISSLFLAAHVLSRKWVSFIGSKIKRHLVSLKATVFVFHPFRLTLSAVVSMDDHLDILPLWCGAPNSVCGTKISHSSCSCF